MNSQPSKRARLGEMQWQDQHVQGTRKKRRWSSSRNPPLPSHVPSPSSLPKGTAHLPSWALSGESPRSRDARKRETTATRSKDRCLHGSYPAIPDLEAPSVTRSQEGQCVRVHLISCSQGSCWQPPRRLWIRPSATDVGELSGGPAGKQAGAWLASERVRKVHRFSTDGPKELLRHGDFFCASRKRWRLRPQVSQVRCFAA